MRSIGLSLATILAGAAAAAPATAHEDPGYRIVWDDFQEGWSVDTPDARWLDFSSGSFVADDGVATTSCQGLEVRSGGRNAVTGEPAFTLTMSQGTGALSPFDHAKWLVIMNHLSSQGMVGFDADPGQELACEADVSGRVYGTWAQPFGSQAVPTPDADPRLGAAAISAFDPETFIIFNFLLTNEVIYAFYERPTFLRAALDDDYAAFSFAVPVMARSPSDHHRLKIAYDRAGGRVRWLVDGTEVFGVDTIGARIDRRHMLVDHGGHDEIVSPAQLDCGMAMFDFLDGYGPTGRGLVQIEPDPGDYFDPRLGEPDPLTFIDPQSLLGSRLFGQGAVMTVQRFVVSSQPVQGW